MEAVQTIRLAQDYEHNMWYDSADDIWVIEHMTIDSPYRVMPHETLASLDVESFIDFLNISPSVVDAGGVKYSTFPMY